MARRWAIGTTVLAMMFLGAASAQAATVVVTTVADDPSADCTGGACSLRGALAIANASPGTVVEVADLNGTMSLTHGPLEVTANGTVIRGTMTTTARIVATTGRAFDIQAGDVTLRHLYVGADVIQPGAGGIDFHPPSQDDQLTLDDVSVVRGSAAQGGGIRVAAGTVALIDSLVMNNSADLGGGIYATDGATVVADGSAIGMNQSTGAGGGVELDGAGMLVLNSTIGRNSSTGAGGAVAVKNGSALLTFNATIARNHADGNGALASPDGSSTFLFVNSILGEPGDVPVCMLNGAQVIDDHSLSADNSCGLSAAHGSVSGVDPRLGDWYAYAGAVTGTFDIPVDSPIVDAGNSDPAACAPIDQAYHPRPQGNACDIGAMETPWSRALAPANPPGGGGGGAASGGGGSSSRDSAPSASSDAPPATPAAPPVTAPAPTATAPTPTPIVFARTGRLSVGATLDAAPKGKVTLAWVVRKGGREHRGQFDVTASGQLLTATKALPAKLKGGRLVRLTAIYRDASGKRHAQRLVPAS